jgi:serine/threonine protein phosphatase 1
MLFQAFSAPIYIEAGKMNFVVGDTHGEIEKLQLLVRCITKYDNAPSFIFIGDYLDKGDNPKAVLDYLLQLRMSYKCTFLLGNHEYYWSLLHDDNHRDNTTEYLLKYGGHTTMNSFNQDNLQDTANILLNEYNHFFTDLMPYTICNDYFVCHSGIPPVYYNTIPKEIPVKEFLFNRYDFISNQNLYQGKYQVIFGHTGFYTPYVDEYKIGVDTAACFLQQQPLTAFCIEDNTFLNSNNETMLRSAIPSDRCPNIPRVKPWRK